MLADFTDRLFTYVGRSEPKARAAIDFDWVHGELPRTGVTPRPPGGDPVVPAAFVEALRMSTMPMAAGIVMASSIESGQSR